MRVLVIGANGATGRLVVDRLKDHRVHEPVAMVRDPEQQHRFSGMGVSSVVADLERPLDEALADVDAVIFAAGSGSKTGPEQTLAVDRDGAVRSVVAAEACHVSRYVMLSSMGADPESTGHPISPYLRAKGLADRHLARSELSWTIVRPGRLTDDPPTGRVNLAARIDGSGSVSRADLAEVLVAVLDHPATPRKTLDLLEGSRTVAEALEALQGI
jgi:uncharacterized protein YbjT (DUF2867 family)